MQLVSQKLFRDFLTFSQLQLKTWDIDPTYPLLKKVYEHYYYEEEEALWHTIVYVTFYHLGSAELFLRFFPSPTKKMRWKTSLPTGTERRGFRGRPDIVVEHLTDVCNHLPLTKWLGSLVTDNPTASWDNIRTEFSEIKFAGNWSSYKLADLLKWVHEYKITAPNFGVGGGGASSGPIPGMVALTGYDWWECARNEDLQDAFYLMCQKHMLSPFEGMDQCETCLCDFNSLLRGSYYCGHDIDLQLQFLTFETISPIYKELRKDVFPHSTLGELNDWSGVRRELKKMYKEHGEIYDPTSSH